MEVPYGDVSGFHLSCTDVDWATFLGSKSEEVQVKFLSTAVVNGTKPLIACACSYQPYQGAVHPCPFATEESAADVYPVLRTVLHADTGLPQSGQDARVDVVGYLCLIQYLYQRDTIIDFSHDFTCRQRYMVSASVLPPDILLPQRPHGRGLTET